MAQGPQSFTDGLQMLASDAMRLATLPDADPEFCMKMAQAAVAKARAPHNAAQQKAAAGPGGRAPGGTPPGIGPQGMPGAPPGGAPANPGQPTLGAPTMGPGPSAGLNPMNNNGDEIRRMIAGATS